MKMKLMLVAGALMVNSIISPIISSVGAAPLVMSTFDTDREGWSASFGASVGAALIWQPTGGNPAGNLVVPDRSDISGLQIDWYFGATQGDGSPLLGNHSNAYGGSLQYDQIVSGYNGNLFTGPQDYQVELRGTSGLTLNYFAPLLPATSWGTFSIPLLGSAGWVDGATNLPATEAQMQLALGNLTAIEIRGRYADGVNTTSMDNVGFFASVPEPSSLALAAFGFIGMAAWGWRRRTSKT